MTTARRLAAVAAAAVLGLGIAGPAHAQQSSHTDARGDVTVSSNCGDAGCTDSVDSTLKQPDVLRVVTTHAARRVKVWAKYADLTGAGAKVHQLRIATNEGLGRRMVVGTDAGRVVFKGLYRYSDGRKVACSGLRASIDYSLNTVAMSVPRGCLSAPRTVRVGFGTLQFVDVNDSSQGYHSDDALLDGLSASTRDLVLGPRLRRG